MTALWEYAFHTKLGVTPSDCKVLLTDPPLNPTANRTRMLEIMFERFVFAGAFIQIQAVLTLYSQGVVRGGEDGGYGAMLVCTCCPIIYKVSVLVLYCSSYTYPPCMLIPIPLPTFQSHHPQHHPPHTGLLTGVVLDSGDGVTHSVPVVDGFSPSMQIRRLNVAGRHITMFLGELLTRRGYALNRWVGDGNRNLS